MIIDYQIQDEKSEWKNDIIDIRGMTGILNTCLIITGKVMCSLFIALRELNEESVDDENLFQKASLIRILKELN